MSNNIHCSIDQENHTNSVENVNENNERGNMDDDSVETYGTIHTFQGSVVDDSPLRKVTPQMKNSSKVDPPPQDITNPEDNSDCSIFSSSIRSFTSLDALPRPSKQDNTPLINNISTAGMPFVSQKSSSLFSLGHSSNCTNIEKLYTTTSIFENLDLHIRCGYAQRQNKRKYMEDSVTICPSYHASDMEEIPSQGKVVQNSPDDFSFFGVYDGHEGSYVAQYLQDHLMTYFYDQLLLNTPPTSSLNLQSANNNMKENEELNKWRKSFLEAACKIDREILLQDAQRLQSLSDKRQAAFKGTPATNETQIGSTKGDSTPSDSFAGSTAAVVIVYRERPPPSPSVATTTDAADFSPRNLPDNVVPMTTEALEDTGKTEGRTLPPLPPDYEHEDQENFHDDVVVGLFAKKDSSPSVNVTSEQSAPGSVSGSSHASSDYSNVVDEDVIGIFPGHSGRPLRKHKRPVQRYSSVDSTYDAPAEELNLDDVNGLNVVENLHNKYGMYSERKNTTPSKRGSTESNISDLTASFGNFSFLHSADDLLMQQYSQPFNSKRRSLVAAVKRSYEENTVVDYSVYDGSQLEELVDDFLTRAALLDKAASDCRGQAAELLQVLEQRVQTSRSRGNSQSNEGSSCSPFMSSLASNSMQSAPSAQSGPSIRSADTMSDLSPNSGQISSSKSYSSLGSITSLRSFDEPVMREKRPTRTFLDTVTEGLYESRATSFAASRQASSLSVGNNIFNEKLRLALVGEIASKNVKMLIAHAGDCRVVLCDGGNAIQVTIDHTPLVDEEKFRINESGGFVSNKRVNGILSVSRSFGDIKFKAYDKLQSVPDSAQGEVNLPGGIWNNRHQVISKPDILELDVLSSYEFVVIASDCVWETLTCSEVIEFARSQMLQHGDTMKAADALAAKVSDDGGIDNCSIIIINLNQI